MGFVRLVAFAVASLLCAGFGFGWLLVMRLLWFLGDFGNLLVTSVGSLVLVCLRFIWFGVGIWVVW